MNVKQEYKQTVAKTYQAVGKATSRKLWKLSVKIEILIEFLILKILRKFLLWYIKTEPHHKETCLKSLQPGNTITGLYSKKKSEKSLSGIKKGIYQLCSGSDDLLLNSLSI